MADDECRGVRSAAAYTSLEGGRRRTIHLLDALQPLLDETPDGHALHLSSAPITAPWPLAAHAHHAGEDESRAKPAKRQRTIDETAQQLERLEEVLRHDIPAAVEALQATFGDEEWLSGVGDERIRIHGDTKGAIAWPLLEEQRGAAQAGDEQRAAAWWVREAEDEACDAGELVHRLVIARNRVIVKTTQGALIAMPRKSAFLLTNLLRSQMHAPHGWGQLLAFAGQHPPSLLLLDPPYPNFSAQRLQSRRETYKPVEDLFDLWNMKKPVQELLACGRSGVLVGCWVTNHAKAQRFILTRLFPAWGLHHVGQVVWVKVTAGDASKAIPAGQLVFPLNNKQGRKPYEVLLLGRTTAAATPIDTKLIASVPLGHSRKPCVFDVLQPHLCATSPETHVYELFARSLFPGRLRDGYWVSVGNEPVAFNTHDGSSVAVA